MLRNRLATPRFVRPCLALALLLAAGAGAVDARELTIATDPVAPTWRDQIRIAVSGEVDTACGPSIVSLTNPRLTYTVNQAFLDVDLVEAVCNLPTLPRRQEFTAELAYGPLVPDAYTLRVFDKAQGNQVTSAPLVVYELATFELVLPSDAIDNAPTKVVINGWGGCPGISDVDVTGRLITIAVETGCSILPPGPFLWTLEQNLGQLAAGRWEVAVVDSGRSSNPRASYATKGTLEVAAATGCVPFEELCLRDERFEVKANWQDFAGNTGVGHPIELPGNDGTGLLWFFQPDNAELTVKVIDGCSYNGHWWVFLSSGSTVSYTVTVTDRTGHKVKQYANALGNVPRLVADTEAFPCN